MDDELETTLFGKPLSELSEAELQRATKLMRYADSQPPIVVNSPRMSGKTGMQAQAFLQNMASNSSTNGINPQWRPRGNPQWIEDLEQHCRDRNIEMQFNPITGSLGLRDEHGCVLRVMSEELVRLATYEELWRALNNVCKHYNQKADKPMLDKLIRLYTAYMMQDVRSPVPHVAGPPGVGKSTMFEQLAELYNVTLHVVNVSRLSPLEIEGVQMPVTRTGDVDHDMKLKLLHSPLWTNLKEGDIVLFDEFMRGFPEVYNGLLDIMTSRQVAGFTLPKVFFAAASNSVAAYDEALRDRLLHIFVPDIRKSRSNRDQVADILVNELGLMPTLKGSQEMEELIETDIRPMYDVLDTFTGKASPSSVKKEGYSVRNLIGQARLREVQSSKLQDLLSMNNRLAISQGKHQYVVLITGENVDPKYLKALDTLNTPKTRDKLNQIQLNNLDMNIELIEITKANAPAKPENLAGQYIEEDDPLTF